MNILLLQGPIGSFFQTLSHQLRLQGHNVFKVHFNGGDAGFYCAGINLNYKKKAQDWYKHCKNWLLQHKIDAVICYGDCRYYHKIAAKLCSKYNIEFWVLEEGYLRQGYITCEQGGVNANSPLFKQKNRLAHLMWHDEIKEHHVTEKTFPTRAIFASYYHIRRSLLTIKYPDYKNHRPCGTIMEALNWVRGGAIKYWYKNRDENLLKTLKSQNTPLFLLPLQVNEDFQIIEHSKFDNLSQVIEKVIGSFASYAPKDAKLLIKHHPQDRGFTNYSKLISVLTAQYKLFDRVYYGYNFPLPEVYPLLSGTVTVNSTVGLSSLIHSVPTLCLGKALYDLPKLTSQCDLNEFWTHASPVCETSFAAFKHSLLRMTQLEGNFYTDGNATAARIVNRITEQIETTVEGLRKVG